MKVLIGDRCPDIHPRNECNAFVGGFVNNDIVLSPNTVPHLEVVNGTTYAIFGNHSESLKNLFSVTYDYDRNEREFEVQEVQALSVIKLVLICQVRLGTIFSNNAQ